MENPLQGLDDFPPEVGPELHRQPAFLQLLETFPALAEKEHQQAFRAYVAKMWAEPESYMDLYRAYMEFLTPTTLKFARLQDYIKQHKAAASNNQRRRSNRRRSRQPRSNSGSGQNHQSNERSGGKSRNSGNNRRNRSGNKRNTPSTNKS